MRLPKWFPAVTRPFNPAYRGAWDAMSHSERQWSFLIDVVIVGGVLIAIWLQT